MGQDKEDNTHRNAAMRLHVSASRLVAPRSKFLLGHVSVCGEQLRRTSIWTSVGEGLTRQPLDFQNKSMGDDIEWPFS